MYQILLIPIAIGIAKLFSKLFESNPDLEKIDSEHIYEDYLVTYFKKDKERIVKQKITSSINRIIETYGHFKIGKSGIPVQRAKQHREYKEMFLLCQSKYPELIENLERYYNEKYINHKKNDNKNMGSASVMSEIKKNYYLYIVVV